MGLLETLTAEIERVVSASYAVSLKVGTHWSSSYIAAGQPHTRAIRRDEISLIMTAEIT